MEIPVAPTETPAPPAPAPTPAGSLQTSGSRLPAKISSDAVEGASGYRVQFSLDDSFTDADEIIARAAAQNRIGGR